MSEPRVAVLLLLLAGCGGDGVIHRIGSPPAPPAGYGLVQVRCDPPDVEVHLDGAYRGTLSRYRQGAIPVREGRRRLELRRGGYYPFYTIVMVRGRVPVQVETHLVPEVNEGGEDRPERGYSTP